MFHQIFLEMRKWKLYEIFATLFQYAGSYWWNQDWKLSVGSGSMAWCFSECFLLYKSASQGYSEVRSQRKCSRSGSSCSHLLSSFGMRSSASGRILIPLPTFSIALWSRRLLGAQKKVPEALGHQIHLLPWAQVVCSLLPEKRPWLRRKLNTEHSQKAKGFSKRDNARRCNRFHRSIGYL